MLPELQAGRGRAAAASARETHPAPESPGAAQPSEVYTKLVVAGRHPGPATRGLSVRLPGPWQEQMPVLLTQHICSKLLNLRAILNFFKKFFLLQNYFYDPFNKDLMVKAQLFRITFYCFHIENSKC